MNRKHPHTSKSQLSPYNTAVKQAYYKLLKSTTQLLASIERDELRYTLQREDRKGFGFGSKLHEIISPIIYLSLEFNDTEHLSIHFGFEMMNTADEHSHITSRFVRLLYKLTAVENTSLDIESCINTDYVITDCSALYETVEDHNKLHIFKKIPYRPTGSKRKRLLHVA